MNKRFTYFFALLSFGRNFFLLEIILKNEFNYSFFNEYLSVKDNYREYQYFWIFDRNVQRKELEYKI